MKELTAEKVVEKKAWGMTEEALRRLLKWLDCGIDSQGRRYEELRQRLIEYFDRRNCDAPEDLTDETFGRVMKLLEEKNKDYDEEPAKLCYSTARLVFLEYTRRPERKQVPLGSVTHELSIYTDGRPDRIAALEEERAEKEKQLDCLEKCSRKLPADDLDLITRFHYGEGRMKLNRRTQAAERGVSANALRTKACRIRNRLRGCVTKCLCE